MNSLKKKAKANIERKVTVLEFFVETGIPWIKDDNGKIQYCKNTGRKVLDFYPKSEIQFAKWTTSFNSNNDFLNCKFNQNKLLKQFGPFTSHGRDTLKNYDELYNRTVKALINIKKVSKDQLLDKSDKIKKLKTTIISVNAKRDSIAVRYIQSRDQNAKLKKKINNKETEILELRKLHETQIAKYQKEMKNMEQENIKLKLKIVQ